MKDAVSKLLPLIFFLYLAWRDALRPKAMPGVALRLKIGHAASLIFLAAVCWDSIVLASFIVNQTSLWLKYLAHERRFYPLWIDLTMQMVESCAGFAGLIFCYMALKRRDWARRALLSILPMIFICFCYEGIRSALHHNSGLLFCVVQSALLTIPFMGVFWLYARRSSSSVLFIGK